MDRFFFIHVQKTAGTSFREQMKATFTRDEIYPLTGVSFDEYLRVYVDGADLMDLEQAERDRFSIIHGHYPFATCVRSGGDRISITILRDPVDRVESLLRMESLRRPEFASRALEEIYDDPALFEMQIRDHQAKVFAITAADRSDSVLHGIDVDAGRLEIAAQNLESVDVVGFQDDLDGLIGHMSERFGWNPPPTLERRNVNDGPSASAALRRRIADDNPGDQEFWEFACELRARRSRRPDRPR